MSEGEATAGEPDPRVGSVLRGKYRIDAVLGVGGMAVVYAATHRNKKRFAVKVLHEELSVRRDLRARFLREGYVANSVDHPGVVAILDDDVDEHGSAFLVMELLDGATVESLCACSGAGLPLREALEITRQLLDVLAVAHAKTIIHRDIKPANLFVLRDGRLKVLDFGIARLRDVTVGVQSTRAGAILGTPAFMAPEQALAQGSDVDPRTDLWAAGATLFTMLTGRFVHEGENSRQMLIRAATVPARSLASVAPGTPAAVVDVVDRALAFERSARWESAAAMGEAIARVQDELFDGPLAPSHWAALLESAALDPGGEPTRPSDGPGAPAPGSDVGHASTLFAIGPSDVRTTTSKPVSNRKSFRERREGRAVATGVASVVVVLGASLAIAYSQRSSHAVTQTAPTSTLVPASSPPLSTMASEAQVRLADPAAAAASTEPTMGAPVPLATATPSKPRVSFSAAAASAPPAAHPITLSASPAAASAAPSSAPARDRLHLELQ